MRHSIFGDVQMVPVSSIRELPRNKTTHPDFDPQGEDAWLVENLRRYGILEPLLIGTDRQLVGGHRRLGWAKLDKIDEVPCLVVQKGCEDAAYTSTQLARQMSVFAKCALYRDKVSDLIRSATDSQKKNLQLRWEPNAAGNPTVADDNEVHQEWIRIEKVLRLSRRSFIRGVKLLDRLDEMRASGNPAEIDRANRILNVFRNMSLGPACRMLNERPDDDEAEPDCIDWQSDDEGNEPAKPANKGKVAAKTLKFAKKNDEPAEPWVNEAVKCLGRIETLVKKHNAYSPVVQASLNAIENEITGSPTKRVA